MSSRKKLFFLSPYMAVNINSVSTITLYKESDEVEVLMDNGISHTIPYHKGQELVNTMMEDDYED